MGRRGRRGGEMGSVDFGILVPFGGDNVGMFVYLYWYGVAAISGLLKIVGLFCRI